MGKNISVNRSPTPKLNELIKLAIETRSLEIIIILFYKIQKWWVY